LHLRCKCRCGNEVSAEKVQLAAEEGEFPADVADRLAIIPAEIGDGLEIGCEASQQPHHFHIAVGFAFQLPAGPHTVEIAIEVELEQVTRVVWGTTGFLENGMPETELLQIERPHIDVDEAHRVFLRDVIVERFGEKCELISIVSLKMVHDRSV
jgi:hypothetical protein